MNIISSADNSLVKAIGKLKMRKYRHDMGQFVLEGYRLVKDAFSKNSAELKIILAESKATEYLSEFPQAYVLSEGLFVKCCDTVNSQGIMAIAPLPPYINEATSDLCLYLDRVRDPGNLGTIIRTAAACGFEDIILDDCVDVYNPKTIRSSMGTVFNCNFALSQKQIGEDYSVVCADAKGTDIRDVSKISNGKKICLIIGNEANGISEDLKSRADITVSLPMCEGVESLNAAVSASIAMYWFKYFRDQSSKH
ncbi:MAG: RNA methyltransferase [Clostridia bacterium]|nr:RNA methyltransferase [Clostridia bacterium]